MPERGREQNRGKNYSTRNHQIGELSRRKERKQRKLEERQGSSQGMEIRPQVDHASTDIDPQPRI